MRTHGILVFAALATLAGGAFAQNVSYPLDVGTKWQWSQYWSTTSYRVEIARDTLAPNGHRYAIIPAYVSLPERWERQEDTRVYRYVPYSGQEWLLFDFSKSPGDTINHSPIVVMYTASVDTLFGTSRRTWIFGVGMVPGIADAGAGYTITDTIGLTDYGDANSSLRVIGAIIGSRTYGTVTGIMNSAGVYPGQILLDHNYPNPFNPETIIKYSLPERMPVTLSVYDILGRVICCLVDEMQQRGSHQVTFKSIGLASGVYLYRLETPHSTVVKKMALVR